MSSTGRSWNPVDLSSFLYQRDRQRRSASEQIHTVTTHEYHHTYRRTESPCEHRNYCEYCPCLNCRSIRQPSYRHHMSRRQRSGYSSDGGGGGGASAGERREDFYSSAHSIRDELRRGSPTGIGISLHQYDRHSPQSLYQQQQQQRTYQPHHHRSDESVRERNSSRFSQMNRRSTREVHPQDQTVPMTTTPNRYDEAVIKRR